MPTKKEIEARERNPALEKLQIKCVKTIAANFAERPVLDQLPDVYADMVVKLLSTDLDVTVAGLYIHDESYWERRSKAGTWRNLNIAEHGMSWKQLYFERAVAEDLEDFDPETDDIEALRQRVQAAEDYVFQLRIGQLLSHLDMSLVFTHLPNLASLDLTYGVTKVGMKYERALFGMKISDATALASCIRHTQVLASLRLARNLIDDDLLRMLMTGLISNSTVTALDLSHNKITNHGARMIGKLLGPKSVIMSLSLADNQIHSEGGRYLGRALRHNESLAELNMRLNRLGDDGGAMLLTGARTNASLTSLNLSCNSLSDHSTDVLAALLHDRHCPLETLDLSGNQFSEAHFATLAEAIADNQELQSIDVRLNEAPMDCEAVRSVLRTVRANELRRRTMRR